jgi:glycosyltransferase involved in cell wall biosynthesis
VKKFDAYTSYGVYFLPTSYGEGMPNALLEAMAFNMVIFTSPVGFITDMFEGKKIGHLIENPTAEKIKHSLVTILENLESSRLDGNYNRKYIAGRCTASAVSRRLINIYEGPETGLYGYIHYYFNGFCLCQFS